MSSSVSAEQRRLTHAVAVASDKALAEIVAYLDGMADRREADRLLDAARPRLRKLRPARPVTFTRLLFLPLGGALVDPRDWRRQAGVIPRHALVCLGHALRQALGQAGADIDARFAGHYFDDRAFVGDQGRRLWRLAADAMPGMERPADWVAMGLSAADYDRMAALAAGVWRHAGPLWDAMLAARQGPPEALVRTAMIDAAAEDQTVLQAMLATLLLQAAKPGSVAHAAAAAQVGPPGLAERTLDRWLEDCTPDMAPDDPSGAARIAEEFAEVLQDLEASLLAQRPEPRRRLSALRRQVSEDCQVAFALATDQALLARLTLAGPLDNAAIAELEDTARALKRLEMAGRGLGGGQTYEAVLRRTFDALVALRVKPESNAADLARLIEILMGADAAAKLLDGY